MKTILLLLLGGIFICGLILIVLSLKSPSSNILSFNKIQNAALVTPHEKKYIENCTDFPLASGCSVAGASINICSTQYSNYPRLTDIETTNANPNLGIYTGKITKVNPFLGAVTVISARSDNSFIFDGGSVGGKIFDVYGNPVKAIYTLKTGVNAVVSFNCAQKNGIFTLNKFQLVQ